MTTLVVCTVPQGLQGIPVGPGGSAVNFTPASRMDATSRYLEGPIGASLGIQAIVDPTAWAAFIANAAYAWFITATAFGPAPLVAPN